jgi:hypothetical protein
MNMSHPALRAAALILPLLGIGAVWARTHLFAQTGTDWEVPVQGYDPRDLLRGHYIQYRYDWPGISSEEELEGYGTQLCLTGTAPAISKARLVSQEEADTAKCGAIVKQTPGGEYEYDGLARGRLFVAQTAAPEMERKLGDPKLKALLKVRIREDGLMRPLSMRFVPRPAEQTAP